MDKMQNSRLFIIRTWAFMPNQKPKVPHRNTVEQMKRESDTKADLKCAEIAMKVNNLTLRFDATTQEDMHVNAIQKLNAKLLLLMTNTVVDRAFKKKKGGMLMHPLRL